MDTMIQVQQPKHLVSVQEIGQAVAVQPGHMRVGVDQSTQPVIVKDTRPRVAVATGVGPKGEPGGDGTGTIQREALEDLGALRVVVSDGTGVRKADPANLNHFGRVVGVTTTAASAGAQVTIQRADLLVDGSINLIPDQPIFVGVDGLLVQSLPNGAWVQIIGFAVTASRLDITLREPIKRV